MSEEVSTDKQIKQLKKIIKPFVFDDKGEPDLDNLGTALLELFEAESFTAVSFSKKHDVVGSIIINDSVPWSRTIGLLLAMVEQVLESFEETALERGISDPVERSLALRGYSLQLIEELHEALSGGMSVDEIYEIVEDDETIDEDLEDEDEP